MCWRLTGGGALLSMLASAVLLGGCHIDQALAAEWIFDSKLVRSADHPREALSPKDPYELNFITDAFPSYSVTNSDDEDGLIVVNGRNGRLSIAGGNGVITQIETWKGDAEDVLGNKIGDTLRDAVGKSVTVCFSGESMYCQSGIGKGLLYLTDDCGGNFKGDGELYEIPDCAKVGGFLLTR